MLRLPFNHCYRVSKLLGAFLIAHEPAMMQGRDGAGKKNIIIFSLDFIANLLASHPEDFYNVIPGQQPGNLIL